MFYAAVGHAMAEVPSWSVTRSATEQIAREQSFSALTETRRDMRIGETYYRFIGPAVVSYIPRGEGWTCYVNGLAPWLGSGGTPELAFDELKFQLHTAFQTLLRKRPFEMTEEERSKWVQLTNVIDLLHYKTTTPITTYEIGQVSFGQIQRPDHIDWISGEKRYVIEPDKVPGDLMSCCPSQWIDAVVQRDPISYSILAIKSVRKIRFHWPSNAELKSAWDKMAEARLGSGEWVW